MYKYAEPPPPSIPSSPTSAMRRSGGGSGLSGGPSKKLLAFSQGPSSSSPARPSSTKPSQSDESSGVVQARAGQSVVSNGAGEGVSQASGDRRIVADSNLRQDEDGVADENASGTSAGRIATKKAVGGVARTAAAPSLKSVPQSATVAGATTNPPGGAGTSQHIAASQSLPQQHPILVGPVASTATAASMKVLRGVVEIAHPAEVDLHLVKRILADALQVPPADVQVGMSQQQQGPQQQGSENCGQIQNQRAVISLNYCVRADAATQRRMPNSEALAQVLSKNIPLRAALSRVIIQHDEAHFGFLMRRGGPPKSKGSRSAHPSRSSSLSAATTGEPDVSSEVSATAAQSSSSYDFNALILSGMFRVIDDALFQISNDGSLSQCRDENVSDAKKSRQAARALFRFMKKRVREDLIEAGDKHEEDDDEEDDDLSGAAAAVQEQRHAYQNLLREYGQLRGQVDELNAQIKVLTTEQSHAADVERHLREEVKFLEDVTSRAEEQLHELRHDRRHKEAEYDQQKLALENEASAMRLELNLLSSDRNRWRSQVKELEDLLLRTHDDGAVAMQPSCAAGMAEDEAIVTASPSSSSRPPADSEASRRLMSMLELRERQVQQLRGALETSERDRLAAARSLHNQSKGCNSGSTASASDVVPMSEYVKLQSRCELAESSLRERSMQLMQMMKADPMLAK